MHLTDAVPFVTVAAFFLFVYIVLVNQKIKKRRKTNSIEYVTISEPTTVWIVLNENRFRAKLVDAIYQNEADSNKHAEIRYCLYDYEDIDINVKIR